MPAKSGQYYRTEQEIAKLMRGSGLPMAFTDPFTRDYAAVKSDVAGTDESLEQVISDISALDVRVLTAESEISGLNSDVDSLNTSVASLTLQAGDLEGRILIVEGDLGTLTTDFNTHEAAESAHGANGDIVGTDDYCTPTVGGTVLLASALSPNASSTLVITSIPAPAPAAYVQLDAITWVNMLTELRVDFNALILEFNQLIAKVNDIIATQETAKQRDT